MQIQHNANFVCKVQNIVIWILNVYLILEVETI